MCCDFESELYFLDAQNLGIIGFFVPTLFALSIIFQISICICVSIQKTKDTVDPSACQWQHYDGAKFKVHSAIRVAPLNSNETHPLVNETTEQNIINHHVSLKTLL